LPQQRRSLQAIKTASTGGPAPDKVIVDDRLRLSNLKAIRTDLDAKLKLIRAQIEEKLNPELNAIRSQLDEKLNKAIRTEIDTKLKMIY
jgi:hypothetical protein